MTRPDVTDWLVHRMAIMRALDVFFPCWVDYGNEDLP